MYELFNLQLNYQVKVVLNLCLAVIITYFAARLLMSSRGQWFQEKVPLLKLLRDRKEVRRMISAGEHARAGEFLVARRKLQEATKVFIDARMFSRAADIFLQLKRWQQAANLYEKGKDFRRAGDIYLDRQALDKAEENYKRAGDSEKLIEVYRRSKQWQAIAEIHSARGEMDKAAQVLEEQKMYGEAAATLEQALAQRAAKPQNLDPMGVDRKLHQLAKKAGELLELADEHQRAGEIYLKYGLTERAGRVMQKTGEKTAAVDMLLAEGKSKEAASLLRQTGEQQRAAAIEADAAFQEGQDEAALDLYLQAEQWSRAADICQQLQQHERAAELYLRDNDQNLAGSAFLKAGQADKAADCFEQANLLRPAAEAAQAAGQIERAVKLYHRAGDNLRAARLLYNENKVDEARAMLDAINNDDKDYSASRTLLGRIHMEKGNLSEAMQILENNAKQARQIDQSNLDTFYRLALVSEQTGEPSKALRTVEELLDKVDTGKLDQTKLEALKKTLTRLAESRIFHRTGAPQAGESKAVSPPAKAGEERRYKVISEIGRGGMGIVYKAKDTRLERIVALKILPRTLQKNPQAVRTFNREARSAAALNHANIVTIYDTGIQEGSYYIAMELIEGQTIKEIIRRHRRLTIESTLEVTRQVLSALDYAHEQKIVHRDLTTSNIMWNRAKRAKIMDFGLARVVEHLASEQSIIGGTPSYMSPEQAKGDPIDYRSDIYSFGFCLFEMLLGRLPFTKGDMSFHHVNTSPPRLKTFDPTLPQLLDDAVHRCMQKAPANRYQTAKEMRQALQPLYEKKG